MSLKQNSEWLEGAYENFQTAIAEELWTVAEDIIDDVREKGFKNESLYMEKELIGVKREAYEY